MFVFIFNGVPCGRAVRCIFLVRLLRASLWRTKKDAAAITNANPICNKQYALKQPKQTNLFNFMPLRLLSYIYCFGR